MLWGTLPTLLKMEIGFTSLLRSVAWKFFCETWNSYPFIIIQWPICENIFSIKKELPSSLIFSFLPHFVRIPLIQRALWSWFVRWCPAALPKRTVGFFLEIASCLSMMLTWKTAVWRRPCRLWRARQRELWESELLNHYP